jgi:hypothetical protein
MQAAQFGELFRSKMDNWKFGLRNRVERNNRAVQIFIFCAFMAMLIVLSIGPLLGPRFGMTVQSKSGE